MNIAPILMCEGTDDSSDKGPTDPSTTIQHEPVYVSRTDPPNTAGNRSGPLIHPVDAFDDDGK